MPCPFLCDGHVCALQIEAQGLGVASYAGSGRAQVPRTATGQASMSRVLAHLGRQFSHRWTRVRPLWFMVATLALAACGKSNSEVGATQVIAKVNKAEITVHQLNAALSRVTNLTPDSAKAASGQLLQQLIDEELLVQ